MTRAAGACRDEREMWPMPTSESERREVAERMREYANDTLKDGSLLKTLKDVTGASSWRYVLDALADMIEPEDGDA